MADGRISQRESLPGSGNAADFKLGAGRRGNSVYTGILFPGKYCKTGTGVFTEWGSQPFCFGIEVGICGLQKIRQEKERKVQNTAEMHQSAASVPEAGSILQWVRVSIAGFPIVLRMESIPDPHREKI